MTPNFETLLFIFPLCFHLDFAHVIKAKLFASFFEISFSFNDYFQQLNGCLFNFKTLKQYPIYFDQSYKLKYSIFQKASNCLSNLQIEPI